MNDRTLSRRGQTILGTFHVFPKYLKSRHSKESLQVNACPSTNIPESQSSALFLSLSLARARVDAQTAAQKWGKSNKRSGSTLYTVFLSPPLSLPPGKLPPFRKFQRRRSKRESFSPINTRTRARRVDSYLSLAPFAASLSPHLSLSLSLPQRRVTT